MQRVEAPNDTSERVLERVNDLLYRQNSISHSLLRFLKDDSVDLCIMEILKDILDLFHGGRVYIFEYDEYYRYQDCTYEVVAEGVLPEIDSLQRIPTDSLPWWRQQTLSGKPVILDSLDQLPKHAKSGICDPEPPEHQVTDDHSADSRRTCMGVYGDRSGEELSQLE